jgi:hypothetical protein
MAINGWKRAQPLLLVMFGAEPWHTDFSDELRREQGLTGTLNRYSIDSPSLQR